MKRIIIHDLTEKSTFSKILSKKAQNCVLISPKFNTAGRRQGPIIEYFFDFLRPRMRLVFERC